VGEWFGWWVCAEVGLALLSFATHVSTLCSLDYIYTYVLSVIMRYIFCFVSACSGESFSIASRFIDTDHKYYGSHRT
jgi:hypothetical protein